MENQQQMFNMTDQNFAKFKQIDKQGELIQNNSNNNVINPSYQMNRGSLLYRSVQGNFENQSQIIQSTSQQNKQIGQYKNQDNFKIVKKVNISQNQQGNGQQGNQPYKFYIGSGNNGDLIRRILLKRQNWVETKDNSTMFVNFKWQQGSRGYRYDRLIETNSYKQAVNHFEFHQEISNKQYLIQNLVQYCQQNQMRVFDSLTPLTFVIDFNDENCETNLNLLLKIYERGLPLNKKKNFNQKSIFEFKRKIRHMFKNSNNDKIQSSYKKFKFKDVYLSDKEKSAYLWLLKPTFLNRGRGIHIFSELGELEKLLTDYFNGYEEKPFGVKEKEKKKIDFVKLNRNSQIIKLNSEYINPLKQNGHTGYQVQHKYNSNKNQISESKEEGQKENQGEKNQNQNENKNENSDQNKNNQNLQLNSPLQISQSTNVTNKEKVIKQGDETENNLDLQNQIIKNNSSIIQSKSQRESRQSLEIKNQNSEQNQNKIQNQYDIGINRQNNQINRRFLQSQQNTVFNDEEQILIQRMSLKSQKKQQPTYYSYQPNNNNNQEKKNFDGNRYIKNTFNGPTILRSYEFVIQKYIERPLLCKQKKFDIRVWVLVNHEMECYFFKEGYIRLSSEKYSNEDDQKENIFIHLTNNAIQVNCENYGKEDEGNQMSFFNFEKQIQKEGNKNFDFQKQVYEQMVEKSMLCLKAAQKKLDPNSRKFCFEIFGYDYILDEDYNAWLIEVNTNPAIEECSALLKMLIPRMIDDAFKLSLDKIFPVKKGVQEVLQQKKQEQTKNQEFLEKKQNKVKDNEVVDQKNEVENLDKNIDQKDNKEIQVNQADTQSKENLEKFFSVKGYKDDENMWQYMGSIKN